MYAVIETGGKQYRVEAGQTIKIEKLELEPGAALEFDKVLLVAKDEKTITIGKPYIEGHKVKAKVVDQGRGKKIEIVKMKRRKHYDKQQGHRQYFTAVEITAI